MALAPLKVNVFEPFKGVDFQRSHITFSETSKLKKLGHPVWAERPLGLFWRLPPAPVPIIWRKKKLEQYLNSFSLTSLWTRKLHIPGDPIKGGTIYNCKVAWLDQKLIFLSASKIKRTALTARFFWCLKRPKVLILDRVTILWGCKWVPFFLGLPGMRAKITRMK